MLGDQARQGKLAVLMSIDKVRFRRTVVPGDQLRLEAVITRSRGSTGQVRCRGVVKGQIACEALIRFMVIDA